MPKDEKKLYTSRGSRFFKLGGLSAKVATSYFGERIKQAFLSDDGRKESLSKTNIVNARRVVETFGQLKGAVMKLGQQISLAADILPPEVTQILSTLQSSAPPVPFAQLREQFAAELGKQPEELFEAIEEEACASASIGQVHRARMKDGREVAVKIQYPGVDEMVDSDLDNLRSLVKTMGRMWLQGDAMKFFDEVRERLTEELDYAKELENIMLFRGLFAGRDDVLIPEPIPELSGRRVLTMTFHRGLSWDELCSEGVPQEKRNRFAARLVGLLVEQFLRFHVLHADPHPGNYALDEKDRIVVYDFGCVKRFSGDFMEAYTTTLADAFHRRYEKLPGDCEKLGISFKGRKKPGVAFYGDVCDMVMEPFHSAVPYAIHKGEIHQKLQRWARDNFMTMVQFDAPAQILMHDRVVAGMYGNLRRLKAEHRWGDLLAPYLK